MTTSRKEKPRSPNLVSSVGSVGASRRVIMGINRFISFIVGTLNQVNVTPVGDKLVLSTPQNIDTNADVVFDSATLDDLSLNQMVVTRGTRLLVSGGVIPVVSDIESNAFFLAQEF